MRSFTGARLRADKRVAPMNCDCTESAIHTRIARKSLSNVQVDDDSTHALRSVRCVRLFPFADPPTRSEKFRSQRSLNAAIASIWPRATGLLLLASSSTLVGAILGTQHAP